MQPVGGGPVKIGFSNDVEGRRKQLEAHYGCGLIVIATMKGGRKEEREVHVQFAHLRLAGHAKRGPYPEQFRPDPELMKFIGRPLLGVEDADPVQSIAPSFRSLGIRATAEWAEWLEELARHYRTTVSGVIDRAMAEWSESEGRLEPPPSRIP